MRIAGPGRGRSHQFGRPRGLPFRGSHCMVLAVQVGLARQQTSNIPPSGGCESSLGYQACESFSTAETSVKLMSTLLCAAPSPLPKDMRSSTTRSTSRAIAEAEMQLQDNVTNSNPAKRDYAYIASSSSLIWLSSSSYLCSGFQHPVSTKLFSSSPEQSLLNTQTIQVTLITMADQGTLATLDVSFHCSVEYTMR